MNLRNLLHWERFWIIMTKENFIFHFEPKNELTMSASTYEINGHGAFV